VEIASGELLDSDRVEEREEDCEVLVDVDGDLMMSRRFLRAWIGFQEGYGELRQNGICHSPISIAVLPNLVFLGKFHSLSHSTLALPPTSSPLSPKNLLNHKHTNLISKIRKSQISQRLTLRERESLQD
jgi:hypothetical protein